MYGLIDDLQELRKERDQLRKEVDRLLKIESRVKAFVKRLNNAGIDIRRMEAGDSILRLAKVLQIEVPA